MKMFLIILVFASVLVLMFKTWNRYALKYNNKILRNSLCKECSVVLGDIALKKARKVLSVEREELKREGKVGTIKHHRLKIICENCGTVNLEQNLYQVNTNKV